MSKFSNMDEENTFLNWLVELLPQYEIINTAEPNPYLHNINGYCTVDFVVVRNKKIICFLEIRGRSELHKYPTMTIGVKKLNTIATRFRKTVILWYSTKSHKDVFCCKYNDALLTDSLLLFEDARYPQYGVPLVCCKRTLLDFVKMIISYDPNAEIIEED